VKPPRPSSALPPRHTLPGTTSIVFGENQLSPRLIGLSPLPTGHRKLFQQLPVRPSTRCYPAFSLPMGRSPRFRVLRHRLPTPPSDSLSLRLRLCPRLNLAGDDKLAGS
jgi:hypothetical protein